jgi:hypothetical protein
MKQSLPQPQVFNTLNLTYPKSLSAPLEWVQNNFLIFNYVIPAQAGNQFFLAFWFAACAGMTKIAALSRIRKVVSGLSPSGPGAPLYLLQPS